MRSNGTAVPRGPDQIQGMEIRREKKMQTLPPMETFRIPLSWAGSSQAGLPRGGGRGAPWGGCLTRPHVPQDPQSSRPRSGEQPQRLRSPTEGRALVLAPCPIPWALLSRAMPALGTHQELLTSLSATTSS